MQKNTYNQIKLKASPVSPNNLNRNVQFRPQTLPRQYFTSPNNLQVSPALNDYKNTDSGQPKPCRQQIQTFKLQNNLATKTYVKQKRNQGNMQSNNIVQINKNKSQTPTQKSKIYTNNNTGDSSFQTKDLLRNQVNFQQGRSLKHNFSKQEKKFSKVSAFISPEPKPKITKTQTHHSTILLHQKQQFFSVNINKPDNKTITNIKDNPNFSDKLSVQKQFSTSYSSKRTSYHIQLEGNKNTGLSYSCSAYTPPNNIMKLEAKEIKNSIIYPDAQENRRESVSPFKKSKSPFKPVLSHSKSPSFTKKSIRLEKPTSLSNTNLKNTTQICPKPRLIKSNSLQCSVPISTLSNNKKSSMMEDIKEQFEQIFEDEESIDMKNISIEDFELIQKIGKGTFGNVFLARQKVTKFLCVIKSLSKKKIKEDKLEEHVIREIKIQSYLRHQHIAPLYGYFDDKEKIYLIMEYMHDGALINNKKKRTQSEAGKLIWQLCSSLNYMHHEKIIHRDIKPENILLNDNYLKIADFGCSIFSDSLRRTLVGCLAYISPEQLNEKPYDDKIDAWCVGMIAYQLLIGSSPFEQHIKESLMKRGGIQEKDFPEISFPQNCTISQDAKNFIQKLLKKDPTERLSMKDALKHIFILKQRG